MPSSATPVKSVSERDPCHCGGLCACCSEPDSFCLACFLPFISYGEASRGSTKPDDYIGLSALYLAVCIVFTPATLCMNLCNRRQVKPEENGCCACLATCFCGPCALSEQQLRGLEQGRAKRQAGGAGRDDAQQAPSSGGNKDDNDTKPLLAPPASRNFQRVKIRVP